ncbi:MAG: hypothetical protein IH840_09105 [Candidatus Heimdallarchaeota archaeon]|nr:hypothetical protein [Candidatus Heimdallarchaeota archaeon]
MIQNFYILGSNQERPISDRTIFADGSSDTSFLVGIDLELSHWSGSKTPSEYKADTSTEICMKFIKSTKDKLGMYDLAMNNHLDVDGILSVFTLIHSEIALKYSTTIIEAATIGDFWGFGSDEAFILFQGLTLFYNDLVNKKEDIRKIYSLSFEEIKKLLTSLKGTFEGIHEGVSVIKRSLKMIQHNEIKRIQYHQR